MQMLAYGYWFLIKPYSLLNKSILICFYRLQASLDTSYGDRQRKHTLTAFVGILINFKIMLSN